MKHHYTLLSDSPEINEKTETDSFLTERIKCNSFEEPVPDFCIQTILSYSKAIESLSKDSETPVIINKN